MAARATEREPGVAPLIDHLRELRRRVGISLAAVLSGAFVAFAWCDQIIFALRAPLDGAKLYFSGVGDAFGIRMQLSLIGGVVLAMPIWLWQAISWSGQPCPVWSHSRSTSTRSRVRYRPPRSRNRWLTM